MIQKVYDNNKSLLLALADRTKRLDRKFPLEKVSNFHTTSKSLPSDELKTFESSSTIPLLSSLISAAMMV